MMTSEQISALSEQTASAYACILFALAFTMGPAIFLLRGRGADDAMMKGTIAVASVFIATRLANDYLVMTITSWIPLGYAGTRG